MAQQYDLMEVPTELQVHGDRVSGYSGITLHLNTIEARALDKYLEDPLSGHLGETRATFARDAVVAKLIAVQAHIDAQQA